MKKYLIAAALVVAATGAVGVGAGNTINLKGSDTLFDFTNAVIAACPGTVGPYAGTGSGNGQAAMVAGQQQVAPMSRFLNTPSACTGTFASPSNSDGLVVALDSIILLASSQTFGSTACNGDSNTACDPNFEVNTGAAYNTKLVPPGGPITCSVDANCPASNQTCVCPADASQPCFDNPVPPQNANGTCNYVFQGWRDVLRILLAGYAHEVVTTNSAAWAARDCNSPIRQLLANSYGLMFENNCSATAGDAQGTCTKIRHIFRRDDFSGTTDTIVGLLNLPSIVNPATTVSVFNDNTKLVCNVVPDGGTASCPAGSHLGDVCNTSGTCVYASNSITQNTGANPFCNAARPAFVFPQSNTSLQPTCLQGPDATWDPTSKLQGLTCSVGPTGPVTCLSAGGTCNTTGTCVACPRESAVYRASMQDNDPIRRPCAGAGTTAIGTVSEDACSHSVDLGLVLPMNDAPENAPHTNLDRYNATPCAKGKFTSVAAPDAYDAVTQAKVICTRGLLCPNGDYCNNLSACIAPADSNANPQCLSNKLNTPPLVISSQAVPLVNPRQPSINDGRSFNQHLYVQVGTAGGYQVNAFSTPMSMTGAYYRIHTNHTLAPPAGDAGAPPPTCQLPDMTDQIGCLVSASPCSLGYAGRQALTTNANAAGIKIKGQSPVTLCVQGHFLYPLSRKLYLNSIVGLANVTGQELALVGCETDLAQPTTLGTPAGVVTSAVAGAGFIQIGPFVNGGEPFCEDFNEKALCGATINNDACNSVSAMIDNFPVFETVCGDGNVDSYEDCDNGTLNGPPPAQCSLTCRNNF